jgi:hypothetical protein
MVEANQIPPESAVQVAHEDGAGELLLSVAG